MAEMTIWTPDFWKATAERILRTAAGALAAVVITDGFDFLSADWRGILSTVGLASLVSLLLALASNASTRSGPAFTHSEQVVPPEPQPTGDDDTEPYYPERARNDES